MEKLHLQPSELDSLPYYEYEYTVEIYNNMLRERKDGEDKKSGEYADKYNINSMQRQAQSNIKAPKMPSMRMPKLG